MYKIFDTIEEFNTKNAEINSLLDYPLEDGTIINYAEPIEIANGKFAMQVLDNVINQFNQDELIENIEIARNIEAIWSEIII